MFNDKRNRKLNSNTHFIRGQAHWAKILGTPRKNNFDDYREWTVDVSPDADGLKLFKQLGIMDRLKDPKDGEARGRFIAFRQRELKVDGTPAQPIIVLNAAGQPWDQKTLIGNGSVVDVKFTVKDYGKTKKKGVYIRAIRVMELVPYVSQEFAPVTEDDEFFAAAQEASSEAPTFEKDFGLEEPDVELDDDIPID